MFAKTIVTSDAFLDMPLSTQALYFHLGMMADDDGFVNSPKKIVRMIGCAEDDLKLLITKRFILTFENGVIVIKHWKINNYIAKDRYKETVYKDLKALIQVKDDNSYTDCIQDVYKTDTQDRKELVKDSKEIDKKNNVALIVDYLNKAAGTNYRASTKATARHIEARLNEGFSVADFMTVIDKKVAEWKGGEMEKYLRPETLFGAKFEGYLNARANGSKRGANGVLMDNRQADELDGIL